MDSPLDSVDKTTPYVQSDRVSQMNHSERDKERKFARALKEKLAEDLQRGRKHPKEDSVETGQEQDGDAETNSDDLEESQDSGEIDKADDKGEEPKSEPVENHVDIKA